MCETLDTLQETWLKYSQMENNQANFNELIAALQAHFPSQDIMTITGFMTWPAKLAHLAHYQARLAKGN